MRPTPCALALAAASLLSGCAGGGAGGDGFPADFLLAEEDAPRGFVLVDLDDRDAEEALQGVELDENPGPLDPRDLEFESSRAIEEAFAAVYWDEEDEGQRVLYSVALEFSSADALADWVEDEGVCRAGPALVADGPHLAFLYGFEGFEGDGDPPGFVRRAASAVESSSGGSDPCLAILLLQAEDALELEEGENGPVDVDDGESAWFFFELDARGTVAIEAVEGAGDTFLTLYDDELDRIGEDDDGGSDLFSRLEETLSAGTYYVELSGFGGSSLDGIVLDADL